MSRVSTGAKELALKIKRGRNVVTQGLKSNKTKEGFGIRNGKPDPYRPSLLHVVTINGFQVLLKSITCLSSFPIERRYLPYSPPAPTTQYMCLIQLANDPPDPYPTPCTLGIKMD